MVSFAEVNVRRGELEARLASAELAVQTAQQALEGAEIAYRESVVDGGIADRSGIADAKDALAWAVRDRDALQAGVDRFLIVWAAAKVHDLRARAADKRREADAHQATVARVQDQLIALQNTSTDLGYAISTACTEAAALEREAVALIGAHSLYGPGLTVQTSAPAGGRV